MGSVYEEISRLETAKSDIETAIETCGVNVPDTELIDTYASYIRQIPSAVFSELNVDSVGGSDHFIQSIKQTNGLIEATVGGLVSTSNSGLVPKIEIGENDTINNPTDEWVLTTLKGDSPTWRKLPIGAFVSDNSDTTYTLLGGLNKDGYNVILQSSSNDITGTTIPIMGAASGDVDGSIGLVPQPMSGDQNKFLSGAGTWNTLPSLYITDEETGNAITDIEVLGHGITLKRETVFSVYGHKHSTEDITALTGYAKETSESALSAADSLNIALGKLEYKADLGKTAYDWYRSVTDADTDEYINKWGEIVDFLDSVKEDTDILDEFVTRKTPQIITGAKTFQSASRTTGVSLKLQNYEWYAGMSTALDFYNGSYKTVPTARIDDYMSSSGGASGGNLRFFTQAVSNSNPNPNDLVERMRITDSGKVWIRNTSDSGGGALTVDGSAKLFDTFIEYNDEINRYGGDLYIQHRGSSDALGSQGNSLTRNIIMTANGGKVGIGGFRTEDMTEDYKLWIYGDAYTNGWSRAKNGFYVEDMGVHYMSNGSGIGQIYLNGNNVMSLGTTITSGNWYFNYYKPSSGNAPTQYIWNAGSSTTYASHTLFRIKSQTTGCSWIEGQKNEVASLNISTSGSTTAYYPWIRQTLASSRWISVGTLGDSLYFVGSSTSRTANGTDYSFNMNFSNGYLYGKFSGSLSGTASMVTVNNSDSNSNYKLLFHSGNTVYSTAGVYCNPYTNALYCNASYQSSDLNLKNIIKPLKVDLDKLSKLRKIYYTWKDSSKDASLQIGMIAQDVESVYPELVSKNENETLSLSYDRLSVVALEGLDVLYQENKELKNRLDKLEKLVSNK